MDAQTAKAETKRAQELIMQNSLLSIFSSIKNQAQIGKSEFKYTGYITDNQITYLRLKGYSVEVIEGNKNLSTIKISWY